MGGNKSSYIIAFVSVCSLEEARSIADAVVSQSLAACCNIVPAVESIYRWRGELCRESEVLCIFKTTEGLFERFKERVVELHSYDVPEVVAVEITAGSDKYLAWIEESCGSDK